jgi:hypothetical protein
VIKIAAILQDILYGIRLQQGRVVSWYMAKIVISNLGKKEGKTFLEWRATLHYRPFGMNEPNKRTIG